jgi:hypothetical protein
MKGAEIPLTGGNMSSGVVRVGDTVRRPAGPWTPAVHALLTHLHDVGFDGAPRPLGIDEQGREVLTFIPGTVAWPNHFHLLDGDAQLRRAARLIREFHDAVAGFSTPSSERTAAAACASSQTPTTSPKRSAWTSSRCLPAAPRPCAISSPSRPPGAPSRGRGYGKKATATPGRPTPTTSPGGRANGIGRSSADRK